jgi:5-methyltetrahydrofolate--homocysteine methyltransferase
MSTQTVHKAVPLREMFSTWPVVTDGAWGTELQKRGLALGDCPDAWNLQHPDRVAAIARTYRDAGCNAVLTNTFRANAISLAAYGLAGRVKDINAAGVRLSKQAGDDVHVIASMGPVGKLLAIGEIMREDLYRVFSEQAAALADSGADALLIETMSDLEEALVAVRASKLTGLPVIVSFVFDTGRNKDRTMTGVTPEQAATAMAEAGVDAVGSNCGNGIEQLIPICRRMRAVTTLPLWMKANAGMPDIHGEQIVYRTTAEEFASFAPALRDAGASFIGGCCGTTPRFMNAVRAALYPCA